MDLPRPWTEPDLQRYMLERIPDLFLKLVSAAFFSRPPGFSKCAELPLQSEFPYSYLSHRDGFGIFDLPNTG